MIKTNITANEALKIAQKYQEKYKVPGTIHDDEKKSVQFYESIFDVDGFAWLVISDLRPNCFEGFDKFTIVISDEKAEVEFILDHNGISIAPHIKVKRKMSTKEDEALEELSDSNFDI